MGWIKKHWRIFVGLLIVGELALAFWFGGGSPESRGWRISAPETVSATEQPGPGTEPPASTPTPTAPTAGPTPQPSKAPAPSPAPMISPSAAPAAPAETGILSPPPTAEPSVPSPAPPERPAAPTEPAPSPPPAPPDPAPPEPAPTPEPEISPEPEPEPEPSPEPVPEPETHTCTVSIRCDTILDNLEQLDPDKLELVPADGVLLSPVTVAFEAGESAFDVLLRACRQAQLHMEYENTPIYNSAYIEGIGNLYEFDCGELSGWMYRVNGWFPNYGCSRYALQPGDVIEWLYTCDLGADVGGNNYPG